MKVEREFKTKTGWCFKKVEVKKFKGFILVFMLILKAIRKLNQLN